MLVLAIQLIAAHDRSLNGRGGKFDAVALGRQVGGRHRKLHPVKPEIAVSAVCLAGAKAHRHRCAIIFAGRNQNAVCVNLGPGKGLGSGHANIVHPEGKGAALKFLYNLRRAIVGIQRGFIQLDGKLRCHCLGQHDRGAVFFVAVFILGDRGVKQLVKANRRHVFNPPFRNVSPHLWRNGESRCHPRGRYTGDP